MGRTKRTRLSGLSVSLLAGEVAEFLHLPPGPGQQLTKALTPFKVIYYFSLAEITKIFGILSISQILEISYILGIS